MLETLTYKGDKYNFPCMLALGCFDAIHVGHRELLKAAKFQAKINGLDLGVMLFRDGKDGKTVRSLEERIGLLESYNVKFVLLIDYNEEFMQISPMDFIHSLEDQLNLKGIMSGRDFKFGAGAKGGVSTLKKYAEDEENAIWYISVKNVMDDGVKISTTRIKELLGQGNVEKADELLGSPFSVSGKVVAGHGRGSELGFPTVNVTYPENKIEIKNGVYKVRSVIDGNEIFGVANYGGRPTFGETECVLEINYDGLSRELYGEDVTVEFLEYLRDIEKFDDPGQLTDQIGSDRRSIEHADDAIYDDAAPGGGIVAEPSDEKPAETGTASVDSSAPLDISDELDADHSLDAASEIDAGIEE